MKKVDMNLVDLVHAGECWTHPRPPCCKRMIQYLERNEELVTWVQPKSGTVQDQFPVIRIKDEYFTMSLRMMKAVWRNVRLRKGFVNSEKAAFGGLKLKIPTLLLVEKMRTQNRFNLMRSMGPEAPPPGGPDLAKDAMAVERGKTSHNASSKVNLVVQKMLFPMLDGPMRTHVLLDSEADQVELDLIDQVGRQKPGVLDDQQGFLAHLQSLLERYRRRCNGPSYARVSTNAPLTACNPDSSLHPQKKTDSM